MRRIPDLVRLAAVLLLWAANCGPTVQTVAVELQSLEVRTADELGVRILFRNPNRFSIDIVNFEYRVSIETLVCGSGERKSPLRLGARDSTRVEFPLHLNYDNLAHSIPALLNDSVSFRVAGSYTVSVLGRQRQEFEHTTRIALKSNLESLLRGLLK